MNKKPISFTKMHGLGNDFMVIDATRERIKLDQLLITQLGNRHTGVGFDQLLLIEPSENADFFCRIYNSDGSEAEQCGNGLRCVARYINEHGLHAGNMSIETKAGVFPVIIKDMDHITVKLNVPDTDNKQIELEPNQLTVDTLSMGNPHAILKVDATESTPVHTLGPEISTHPHFHCGANVGFMEVISRDHIKLRTYERGAGETHACGSNACAAAITGIRQGWLDHRVQVEFRYGALVIEWEGEGQAVYMTGGAVVVYEGVV